jgi:hypothetical protein
MSFVHTKSGEAAEKSTSVWGIAFYQNEPWPQERSFFTYDCAPPFEEDGKQVLRFDMENGWAGYEVIEATDYDYTCRLLRSAWRPMTSAELADCGR